MLLEPNPLLSNNKHLTTARCLVQIENGKAMLRILNPTHSDIQLHAREILANVIQIEEPNIFAMETPSYMSSGNNTNKLNFDLSNSDLTPAQKTILLEILQKHKDSFASDLSELGRTAEYRHKIETIPGARPVRLPHYRTTPQNLAEIDRQVQIMFAYEEPETSIMAIEDNEIHQILQDKDTLFRLQSECRDYVDIIKYLTDGSLPEDRNLRDKVVSESQHYCIMDQILYHLFQRRCKRQAEEFKFIYQLAIPRKLRKNAFFAYHDSLAGGGHLGIDKVRFIMMQKYYWPRMNQRSLPTKISGRTGSGRSTLQGYICQIWFTLDFDVRPWKKFHVQTHQ